MLQESQRYIAIPNPNPEWSPRDVVNLQFAALACNDHPERDCGIAVVFALAAPAHQQRLGPFGRFVRMLRRSSLAGVIDHKGAEIVACEVSGAEARLRVQVRMQNGAMMALRILLGRQRSGPLAGCWMTTAVHKDVLR